MYADDVVVFLAPTEFDLTLIREILTLFYRVTGLATNLSKSKTFPIRCSVDHLGLITGILHWGTALPVAYAQISMQPVVDKVTKCLPPWKGRMLNKSGHLILA